MAMFTSTSSMPPNVLPDQDPSIPTPDASRTAPSKGKSTASKPQRRFVGKSTGPSSSTFQSAARSVPHSSIPKDILEDKLLNEAIAQNVPKNYEFEVHKVIWNVRKWDCKMVGLQMPEGLLMWACILSDIVERFTLAQTVILGDVTYGACCIDDYTALALGCDLLVHYGHSCLVPIDTTTIRTLYVFVEISIDSEHLTKTVRRNFPSNREDFLREVVRSGGEDQNHGRDVPIGSAIGGQKRIEGSQGAEKDIQIEGEVPTPATGTPSNTLPTRLALVSTIQFAAALNRLKDDLSVPLVEDITESVEVVTNGSTKKTTGTVVARKITDTNLHTGHYDITVPRSKPLSPGEILGCTAPRLKDVDAILYLADGRFHLEAIMIANPSIPAFRYDPYSKKLTREWYEHDEMRAIRGKAVKEARTTLPRITGSDGPVINDMSEYKSQSKQDAVQVWGVILGTLGRQGSLMQMEAILRLLETYGTGNLPSNSTSIPYMPILLSELSPAKLALFNEGTDKSVSAGNISTFIQTSCPRLSIDWGYAFERPLLSPYEAAVALGKVSGWGEETEAQKGVESKGFQEYPMNFYEAGSVWAVSRTKGAETPWPI